jgi:hypothetical protein
MTIEFEQVVDRIDPFGELQRRVARHDGRHQKNRFHDDTAPKRLGRIPFGTVWAAPIQVFRS